MRESNVTDAEFKVPQEFNVVTFESSNLIDGLEDDDEVVLIQAPFDFQFNKFNEVKIKLPGHLQTQNAFEKSYRTTFSTDLPPEFSYYTILVPDKSSGNLKPKASKTISGHMTVMEAIEVPAVELPGVPDRHIPFPSILKGCHEPFGSGPYLKPSRKRKKRDKDSDETEKEHRKKSKKSDDIEEEEEMKFDLDLSFMSDKDEMKKRWKNEAIFSSEKKCKKKSDKSDYAEDAPKLEESDDLTVGKVRRKKSKKSGLEMEETANSFVNEKKHKIKSERSDGDEEASQLNDGDDLSIRKSDKKKKKSKKSSHRVKEEPKSTEEEDDENFVKEKKRKIKVEKCVSDEEKPKKKKKKENKKPKDEDSS